MQTHCVASLAFSNGGNEVFSSKETPSVHGKVALAFKAARKTVKIHPDEQGTVLFEVENRVYRSTVCRFGENLVRTGGPE